MKTASILILIVLFTTAFLGSERLDMDEPGNLVPETVDGWYIGAGGSWQLGLEFGFTIRQLFDLEIDMKVPRSEKFNGYYGSPFHGNVTLGFRF
jgi:hypothetical protein